jgi:hypothetical protein
VVALPGDEKNVRCFSGVAMLIIDEAARVADALYYTVRPIPPRCGASSSAPSPATRSARRSRAGGLASGELPRSSAPWPGSSAAALLPTPASGHAATTSPKTAPSSSALFPLIPKVDPVSSRCARAAGRGQQPSGAVGARRRGGLPGPGLDRLQFPRRDRRAR